ncbi:MAG: hypothetical protein NTZ83_01745, partial [Candidatus Pacearchaeota archaeon]|nr:hypothetical protein [Candidatus Pacearchaeota archaeon]
MKKETTLIIGIFTMIILGSALISAAAVCCEKTLSGKWCQDATNKNECNLTAGFGYMPWEYKECISIPECFGTCVYATTGECSENTPQKKCKEAGGKWYEKPIEEVTECKEICCIMGQTASFLNPVECKARFTQYNIQGTMRGVSSRAECEALQTNIVTGACVISTATEDACVINTNTECTSENINELKNKLKNPAAAVDIDVDFNPGILCTATLPNGKRISDCVPTNNTVCEDNKIYYRDGCGNLANVYDANKWYRTNNATSVDYWTYMKKWDDPSLCTVNPLTGSSTCGNCDTTENTVCESYKDTDMDRPSQIANPDGLVCGSMACRVDLNGDGKITAGETKQHGESWCGQASGTVTSGIIIIDRDLTTSEIDKADLKALRNASKYNLPGSRYYKLRCEFGEVLIDECRDYRNEVCVQGKNEDTGKSEAICEFNPWRTCLSINTRTQCEDNTSLCKWVPGYRWDFLIVSEDKRKEMQGSCLPLIAPGFDFWKPNSQGNAICGKATVQEAALFETGIFTSRKKMTGTTAESWPLKHLANNCLNGCYAIPSYGIEFNQRVNEEKQYPEEIYCPEGTNNPSCSYYDMLTEFYDDSGYKLPDDVKNYALSTRRGQYCHKGGKPDQWLTGLVRGPNYDCTAFFGGSGKTEEKERDYPIYLTNEEWLKGITERAI